MRIHRIFGLMAFTYLIETPHRLFLVDAGFVGHGRTILRKIRSLGRDPHELELALITHGHLDHFGGVAEVRAATGARIAAHPLHADIVATGGRIVSPGRTAWGRTYGSLARAALPRLRVPAIDSVASVRDGEDLHDLGLPGYVYYTPGHSDGCISLLLDDGTAIVGDLIQGKRLPSLVPELPNMAQDSDRAHASWRRLLEAGATSFLPAHSKPFTAKDLVGTMRRDAVLLPSYSTT